jgi:UDP-glucose 4-epimerase
VIGVDNFSNSSPAVLDRLRTLGAGVSNFVAADVTDRSAMTEVFSRWPIEAVIHFAAFKAVGESVARPLLYYANNVGGLISLTEAMRAQGCRTIVFSSTATVYGQPRMLPVSEDAALAPSSPYARTKLTSELLLNDLEQSEPGWRIALLRYFNPVGAHHSGTIGEDPQGTPNNLMPFVAQVAVGRRPVLQVFGADYPTDDGTGIRDYVHVQDLAEGHVAALRHLQRSAASFTANLGTGRGVSVLELVRAFERASGRTITYEVAPRRPGDVAAYYADVSRAKKQLGWEAKRGLDAMCADSWRWQLANPNGYRGSPATSSKPEYTK